MKPKKIYYCLTFFIWRNFQISLMLDLKDCFFGWWKTNPLSWLLLKGPQPHTALILLYSLLWASDLNAVLLSGPYGGKGKRHILQGIFCILQMDFGGWYWIQKKLSDGESVGHTHTYEIIGYCWRFFSADCFSFHSLLQMPYEKLHFITSTMRWNMS